MPQNRRIEIQTGSRLHLGLMELSPQIEGCYGGLGVMIREPGYRIVLDFMRESMVSQEPDILVSAQGELQPGASAAYRERIFNTWQRWTAIQQRQTEEVCTRIEVLEAVPLHYGLGAGTQLGCAVAAGLALSISRRSYLGKSIAVADQLSAGELSRSSGRGLRSAIGLTGFLYGGFIFDEGYPRRCHKGQTELDPQTPRHISTHNLPMPDQWRVVLLQPSQEHAVHGDQEANLLGELGQSANPSLPQMQSIARQLLDVLRNPSSDQFTLFAGLVDKYAGLAGELFLQGQSGLYRTPEIAAAVQLARRSGLVGVGQSSWGPSVFSFAEHQAAAETAAKKISEHGFAGTVRICQLASTGAAANEIHAPANQRG